MKTALTIAGSDPSGGAGLQADLRAFAHFGVRGLSAVTAVTAQNSSWVRGVVPVEASFVRLQIETLLDEFTPDAVKVGMLATADNLAVVAGIVKEAGLKNLVLDPVMRASGGQALLDEKGVQAMKDLISLSRVVTPNLDEAAVLSGVNVTDIPSMEEAAGSIRAMGAECVLVKGGHLDTPPVDVLLTGKGSTHFTGERIDATDRALHGTGCTLSAAIAAGLALGKPVKEAIEAAREYTRKKISGED